MLRSQRINLPIEEKQRPILVLDFDGVLHRFTSGWQGPDIILDPPVQGAFEFLRAARKVFDIWICSTRLNYPEGRVAVDKWLRANFGAISHGIHLCIEGKPPAHVTLDDRAITFKGKFPAIAELLDFVPWNGQKR